MKLSDLHAVLARHPATFPRFVLPDGGHIPVHVHVTEVGHVVRNFIDCGGVTGTDEKVLLQAHVGDDAQHRLKSDRFAKILELGNRVLPAADLNVEVEYDCCVVAQYPIEEAKPAGKHLDLILGRGRTQCRARERREASAADACCATATACC